MNNKHLSCNKEINNNFIIASRAYFLHHRIEVQHDGERLGNSSSSLGTIGPSSTPPTGEKGAPSWHAQPNSKETQSRYTARHRSGGVARWPMQNTYNNRYRGNPQP